MKKSQERGRGKDVPGLADRMKWLLFHYWNNNSSAMARDLGCSHTAIYKIVRLGRAPGPQLLAALKSHPRVNSAWVLTGEGDPIVAATSVGNSTLPIAEELLPGAPNDYPDLLSPSYFPVAELHYRPSRYWYRIGRTAAILKTHEPVVAGDLLLMETDPGYWAQPEEVHYRLCAVRINLDRDETILLAKVAYWREEDGDYLQADIFPQPPKPIGKFKLSPRRERPIELGDILAVCVLLVRE